MKIRIRDYVQMFFLKVPVLQVRRAAKICEAAGLDVSLEALQMHAMAGGNIRAVTDGLVLARELAVDASWSDVCMLDLAGAEIRPALEHAAIPLEIEFSTLGYGKDEPIEWRFDDGSTLRLTIHVRFRFPVCPGWREYGVMFPRHSDVALAAWQLMTASPTAGAFLDEIRQHEQTLFDLAASDLKGVISLRVSCNEGG
ncbi:MAG: hypothetical protein CMJ18_04090 [Phycisphaeraceae bacterium]|nr:hypothetical protein [Phycisphaeraceae bacterium]